MGSENFILIPWCVEDAHYSVKVNLPGVSAGYVSEIRAASDAVIPTLDWEAHGFDDFQLDLCVMRALNDAGRDCKCLERCRC